MSRRLRRLWMSLWMRGAGHGPLGRLAMRLASWAAPPHRAQKMLARMSPVGFVSPSATRFHPSLRFGEHVYVANDVVLYSQDGSGLIHLGNGVHVYQETFLETAEGGEIHIGPETAIHARCQLMAYKGSIRIGRGVGIAYGCSFYPSDHGVALGQSIRSQPFVTRGDIHIGDEAWLGTGVTVLSGVRVGSGAVIAAGSVVMRDVPDNAIAAGVPARVIGTRWEEAGESYPEPVRAAGRHTG